MNFSRIRVHLPAIKHGCCTDEALGHHVVPQMLLATADKVIKYKSPLLLLCMSPVMGWPGRAPTLRDVKSCRESAMQGAHPMSRQSTPSMVATIASMSDGCRPWLLDEDFC
jgi:hypothetical protein